jgi:hypothetical protein
MSSSTAGHVPDKREEAYLSGIAAAAARLLEHCPPDEAPSDTIDAALRLGLADRFGHRSLSERRDVPAEIHRTTARRQFAFWWAAKQRNGHRWLQGRPVEHIGQIALFGYSPGLQMEDLEWLLAAAQGRAADHERKLPITTALGLWRDAGSPADILARIEGAARSDPAMAAIVQHWVNPPEPPLAQAREERKYEALRKRRAAEQADRDRSWVEFIERLRENPEQLRKIPAPTPEGVDARLHHFGCCSAKRSTRIPATLSIPWRHWSRCWDLTSPQHCATR